MPDPTSQNPAPRRWPFRISRQQIPLIATAAVWLLLYVTASIRYYDNNFLSWPVFRDFFKDNAFLGVAAVGLTFVILSGGIDLSVGAVIAFTSVLIASLIARHHVHPALAAAIALAAGAIFGAAMGCLITFFELPSFLVTLAGMFLARGGALLIASRIPIDHPLYSRLGDLGAAFFPIPAILFLATVAVGSYLAHFTRFGRAVYAIGGNRQSAVLMGLPVRRTSIAIYALSGFCAALGGLVSTIYTSAGDATAATGLELDAIAAVVIGGTLLTGGVGYVLGTLIGVLILGIVQTAITNEGTLNDWWTKIVIGALLLAFILLQKTLQLSGARKNA
jgi:simple sugar transport system permease protein